VTLNTSQIALHNHNIETETQVQADKSIPGTTSVFARSKEGTLYQGSSNVTMNPSTLAPVGGGQPHNNLMPYLTLNFCIALRGVFPQRG
jgi:microcystin-dependent protein